MEIICAESRGTMLLPPTMSAEPLEGREIGVPDMVMTPPGVSVWPWMTSGAAVMGGAVGSGDRLIGIVLLPITREDPDVGSEMGTLLIVIVLPGVRVVLPSSMTAEPEVEYGTGVLAMVTVPTLSLGGEVVGLKGMVLLPITIEEPSVGREIGTSLTVMMPPGVSVCELMRNCEVDSGVARIVTESAETVWTGSRPSGLLGCSCRRGEGLSCALLEEPDCLETVGAAGFGGLGLGPAAGAGGGGVEECDGGSSGSGRGPWATGGFDGGSGVIDGGGGSLGFGTGSGTAIGVVDGVVIGGGKGGPLGASSMRPVTAS